MNDKYMKSALELARKGFRHTWPNPCVGAVLVKDGFVVGRGYHRRAGGPHAEIEALREAGGAAYGATLYVTLEPCSHYGRTPPCTDALIRAGVKSVVCAMKDPNPKVNGRGFTILRESGLEVSCGLMEKDARLLNRPFVALKIACTMDFKIANIKGGSKWITSLEARKHARRLRSSYDAILTGVGTVLADDPMLSARSRPLRVILDSYSRTPKNAKVLRDENFLIVNNCRDLRTVLSDLWWRGIRRVFVEAGNAVNTSFIKAGLVDKFYIFVAPSKFFGTGLDAFCAHLPAMSDVQAQKIGDDLLFELDVSCF